MSIVPIWALVTLSLSALKTATPVEDAPAALARGRALFGNGDTAGAKTAFALALELAKATNSDRFIGEAAEACGTLQMRSDPSAAKGLFDVALQGYKAAGDIDGMIAVHRKLGTLGDAAAHDQEIARLESGELEEPPEVLAAPDQPLAEQSGTNGSEGSPSSGYVADSSELGVLRANHGGVEREYGLDVRVALSLGRFDGTYDGSGNTIRFDDRRPDATTVEESIAYRSTVLNLSTRVDLGGWRVGADVPIVFNGELGRLSGGAAGETLPVFDASGSGVGDVRLLFEALRLFDIPLDLGFLLKLSNGKHVGLAANELALGTGQSDLGATLTTYFWALRLSAGYVLRGRNSEINEDPGNVLMLEGDIGFTLFRVGDAEIAARLGARYFTTGDVKRGEMENPDTGSKLFSLIPAIEVSLSGLTFELRGSLYRQSLALTGPIPLGHVQEIGIPISARNELRPSGLPLTLALRYRI